MKRLFFTTILAIALTACAGRARLSPAPGAQIVPGEHHAATSTSDGVEVVARSHAWSGFPRDLNSVTPMLVTVRNDSNHPICVNLENFGLITPTGSKISALPPFNIDGTETVEVVPYYSWRGFHPASFYSRFYPGFSPWGGPFYYNPRWYAGPYSELVDVQLPTQDMLKKALPEGVVEPGGSVTGFVYFHNVPKEVKSVEFHADLSEPGVRTASTQVDIPFDVE